MSSSRPQTLNRLYVRLPNANTLTQVTFQKIHTAGSMSFTQLYQCSFENYQAAKEFLTWANTLGIDFVFTRSLKNMPLTHQAIKITLPENIYNELLPKMNELIQKDMENDKNQHNATKSSKSTFSSLKTLGNKLKQKFSTLFSRNISDNANLDDENNDDSEDDEDMLVNYMTEFHLTKERAKAMNLPHDDKSIIVLMNAEARAQSLARKKIRAEIENDAIALAIAEAESLEKAKQLSIEDTIIKNTAPHSPDEFKRDAFNRIVYPITDSNITTSNSNSSSTYSSSLTNTLSL